MNKQEFTTPVLLLCFNRPEQTQQVFDTIRAVKPTKLYVAVDAPRDGRPGDVEGCNKVKEIVHNVDWPCETHYLEQEKNLGCAVSGYTSWKWICETEDRFLFIEDDGIATQSAFYFVQEMLERYKDDERLAYVGGVNFGPKYGDASYFFSRYPDSTYFMGVWRRTIEKYEFKLESYWQTKNTKEFRSRFNTFGEYKVITAKCEAYIRTLTRKVHSQSYDIQMLYLSYKYDMISIYPNINLVTNIGFAPGATNGGDLMDENDPFFKEYANRKRFEMTEIIHPEKVYVDLYFEKQFFKKRILFLKPWYQWYFQDRFRKYFGSFYQKFIKPIRYRK